MAKDKEKKPDAKKKSEEKAPEKQAEKKPAAKKDEKKAPPKKKDDKKSAPKKDQKKAPSKKKDDKPKVQPGDKKKDDRDLKQKALKLLMKHPELANNARALFRNENGKTIVEETVPRGDLSKENLIYPRSQGDLDEDDLRGLAVYASTLMDKTIASYDFKVAQEDALTKAIWNKDGGKYANKINQNTFQLILDQMTGIKKAAEN